MARNQHPPPNDNDNDNDIGTQDDPDPGSRDLPSGMFRSGTQVKRTTIRMYRLVQGVINIEAQYTEVDGNAIFKGDIGLGTVREIAEADQSPAPLAISRDLDTRQLLDGVSTVNLHPHLPHLHVPAEIAGKVDVLARQPLNVDAPPHPFVQAGNKYFNALLRIRSDEIGGTLLACDATLSSSAFGGLDSLKAFWRNLARLTS